MYDLQERAKHGKTNLTLPRALEECKDCFGLCFRYADFSGSLSAPILYFCRFGHFSEITSAEPDRYDIGQALGVEKILLYPHLSSGSNPPSLPRAHVSPMVGFGLTQPRTALDWRGGYCPTGTAHRRRTSALRHGRSWWLPLSSAA